MSHLVSFMLVLMPLLQVTPPADRKAGHFICSHARAAGALPAQATPEPRRIDGPGSGGGGDGGGDGGIAEGVFESDVLHYALELEIDPDTHWLGGSNTITVRSMIDGLTVFDVRIDSAFDVTSVLVNGVAADWSRLNPQTIEVSLDRPYGSGEEFDVTVAYDGSPTSRGFGSIEFQTHGEGPDIFPLVYSLSETWFAYTWWPTKDDNRDKATADLWFIVPDTMSVASNGVLEGTDDIGGGRQRFRWRTDYPTATYLFCFAASNYNVHTQTYTYDGGTMPVQFFIYPEDDTSQNRNAWFKAVDMLGTFATRYGLYPFIDEKYGMVEVGFGGGMEHQTMTSQGTFSEWVTAHELAHQWWGDMITCATWHDIWLNEGFATYSEAIWAENKPGSSGESALHDWMANRRPRRFDGSVYVYNDADFNRIFSNDYSYRKGGWVLHMLRHVVGDDVFFNILADYRAAFAYGSATTEEFVDVAEAVYGNDLSWFFGPWIYEIGAPDYAYGWRPLSIGGRDYVELLVTQTQPSHYPVFTMPVDIVVTSGGNEATHVVWNDAQEEHLLFPVAAPADSLAFDPKHWILTAAEAPTEIPFEPGPPKVVATSPAPGAVVVPSAAREITIQFQQDVSANTGDFLIAGDVAGAIPFTLRYDPGTWTATLEPIGQLPFDGYAVTVSDALVDAVSGLALDGEVGDPSDPSGLPSGDGLPGGSATVRFTVQRVDIPGDLNCDGALDGADIDPFFLALGDPAEYENAYPDCDIQHADANQDGEVDGADIDAFFQLLGG